ncbi:alpha/beta hydrolase-fold protein [Tenacibaculum xiamenense]|uniref:alpha/beta hydrolase-fold protein n=1 Tax=Tenacibaculum xiamenense TaxID=1261553 RepID=UPI0038B4927A
MILTLPNKVLSQKIKIKSRYLNESRTVSIRLPDNYECSKATYPIILVTDGGILFDYVKGLFIYNWDLYPDAILVGIDQLEREKELVPMKETEETHENFFKYVNDELLNELKSNYRVNGINIIIGHSFGGYFSIKSLLKNNNINYAISISTTLWKKYGDNIYSEFSKKQPTENNFLYLGSAENDHKQIKNDLVKLNEYIEENKAFNIKSSLEEYPNEDHNSSILIGIRKGLLKLFKNWPTKISEKKWDEIYKYKKASIFYNHFKDIPNKYKIIPSEEDYNSLGYYYLEQKKINKAIETFELNAKIYPCSSNAYDSLAEAYEINNENKKALSNYKKALKMEIKGDNDINSKQQYTNNIKRVKSKLR